MKIMTLNIWGGKMDKDLLGFIKTKGNEIDVFCFQEVFNGIEGLKTETLETLNIYSLLSQVLPNHKGFYAKAYEFKELGKDVSYGLAMFVKKDVEIINQGHYDIFETTEDLGLLEGIKNWNRLLQYVTIPYKDSTITIFNLHGLYTGGEKNDVVARLNQSKKVRDCMQIKKGKKILCGDFNLNPETESMNILEQGMRNLIKEKGISSTRSHYYTGEQKFADYILVSPEMDIVNFEVLQDIVSDHLPLYLEIK